MSTQPMEERGSGWLEFTAVLLFAVAFFRIISAITYFADSRKVTDLQDALFSSHTWGWGLWDAIIATVAIVAGMSLLAGRGFGRFIGYAFGVLVIVQGFLVIGFAPWYAALAITIGVLVVYGLAVTPKGALS